MKTLMFMKPMMASLKASPNRCLASGENMKQDDLYNPSAWEKTAQLVLVALLLLATPNYTFASNAAGGNYTVTVEKVSGKNAYVLRGDAGKQRKITQGTFVSAGETIVTGANTNVVIRLKDDGSKINIGHNSKFRIEHPETNPNWKATFRLLSGWVRSLVRKNSVKSDKVKQKIFTPSGTIGVRGTEFAVEYDSVRNVTTAMTFEGVVAAGPAGAQDSELVQPIKAGEALEITGDGKFIDIPNQKKEQFRQQLQRNGDMQLALADPMPMKQVISDLAQAKKVNPDEILIHGVYKGDYVQVQHALAMKANPNLANKQGDTVLMDAAKNGYLRIAALLIKYNVSINRRNKDRQTALMYAAQSDNPDMVRLLLEQKADPNLKDRQGLRALDYAMAMKKTDSNKQIVDQLRQATKK